MLRNIYWALLGIASLFFCLQTQNETFAVIAVICYATFDLHYEINRLQRKLL